MKALGSIPRAGKEEEHYREVLRSTVGILCLDYSLAWSFDEGTTLWIKNMSWKSHLPSYLSELDEEMVLPWGYVTYIKLYIKCNAYVSVLGEENGLLILSLWLLRPCLDISIGTLGFPAWLLQIYLHVSLHILIWSSIEQSWPRMDPTFLISSFLILQEVFSESSPLSFYLLHIAVSYTNLRAHET